MVMVMVMEFNVGEPLALGATILGDHQKKQKQNNRSAQFNLQ